MTTHSIYDFIQLIAKLRNPKGGCPWDLAQTYQTMIPCLIEESYEVVEAIEQNNTENLREELGDLLLQVVFLSQLATEENKFTFDDVINDIATKIIRRHPHVFGDTPAENAEQALQNWNAIKAQENKTTHNISILDNIPSALPALMRAEKIQKRCRKVGFDWQNIDPVLDKVAEELQEVREEIQKAPIQQDKIEEEIGDLLFAVTNLARHLKCEPELALRNATKKFERRFRAVEIALKEQGKTFQQSSLNEMDQLWNEIKQTERQNNT